MILSEFALVAANTARSKAYIQLMTQNSLIPAKCYLLVNSQDTLHTTGNETLDSDTYFRVNESILTTIEKYKIPYTILHTTDINNELVANILQYTPEKYFIYSGYGGSILASHLFKIQKKWIHIHAGLLPQYRGSTTAYYSILCNHVIGASAIFLDEHIDQGAIISCNTYPCPPPTVNIDYIYEPYIRAKLLVSILKEYINVGEFSCTVQNNSEAQMYYIIHPLLKHLAMLGLDNDLIPFSFLNGESMDE